MTHLLRFYDLGEVAYLFRGFDLQMFDLSAPISLKISGDFSRFKRQRCKIFVARITESFPEVQRTEVLYAQAGECSGALHLHGGSWSFFYQYFAALPLYLF